MSKILNIKKVIKGNSSEVVYSEKDSNSPIPIATIRSHASYLSGGEEQLKNMSLKRDLKARHVTMIAMGGALGTGLVITSGSALASSGPASTLIAFIIVGGIMCTVMSALGEMATYLPLPDGFAGYSSRFVDPCLGFAVGYSYWIKYMVLCPNQLTASALVIQYWVDSEKVNPGVWITIFLIAITFINYFGVKYFGEFEFWLSSIKIITVVGLILLLFIIMLGGGPTHDRLGFRYWKDPGSFKTYSETITGDKGRFVAFVSTLVSVVFSYLGTELVGVTVGETQNPRRNVPRAIKLTFFRILFFYIISVLLLGMCVPFNDKRLIFAASAGTSASASPFVVAIQNARIRVLPQIINAAILLFVFSASNSDMYIGSRTLYGLAVNGKAPKIFARTNKNGVPIYALGVSVLFCLLAYMNVSSSAKTIFIYFVNVVSMFGLLTWISILVTHICFMRAVISQGYDRHSYLVWCAPFQPYASYVALFLCIIIAIFKNFTVFIGDFQYKTFITGYIGIPVYLLMLFGYKIFMKSKRVLPETADLYTFKDVIDNDEAIYLEKEAIRKENLKNNKKKDLQSVYEKFIGWLF
ncbi:uncharacterized protein PRCAT00004223001 [Priceomyces carsonii]|uniref:uncharacterized protein n=1 Tax=Priceomyces carsonii TaxID=28549 RepID=UPI002EDA12A7|nr:unnamed protein product [Priceomyces carsonii]